MKKRLLLIFSLFAAVWSFLVLRGAQLQFLPHAEIQARQEKQFQTVVRLESRRGAILDRKGRALALSVRVQSLFADPSEIENPRKVAAQLAKKLRVPASSIYAKIKDRKKRFIWLARKIEPELYQEINAMGMKGLGFIAESKRIYPNEKLLAPTLGFVGMEGQGLEGLELSLEKQLQGGAKQLMVRRDARGRPLILDGLMFAEAAEGQEVELTIDSEMQHELEKELEQAIQQFAADQAFGIVLDANSSEIMAMGMAPGFDANKASNLRPDRRRNKTVTDLLEPGSVIKTFAVAAALEEKLIQPNTRIDTEGGRFKVGDRWIREADQTHKWTNLTVSEILAVSSNVGASKIAFQVGDERLRRYLEMLGFGTKTGIEISAEGRGVLAPLPWNQHLLANVSFGHGISSTPVQIAAAYAAIANGGIWRRPNLVKSVRDAETGLIKEFPESEVARERRVFSTETSHALRLMLSAATGAGATGANARVEGFPVAGKTGTAQKVNNKSGGYLEGAYISSFAGFIPAQNPKYVIYVAVDHPKKQSYYGSQVAAPIFARLATFVARLEGWSPVLMADKNLVRKPRFPHVDDSFTQARGTAVLIDDESSELRVPDFRNLTMREVLKSLEGRRVEVRVVGSGLVHQTAPSPGSSWGKGKYLTVYLRPNLKAFPQSSEGPLEQNLDTINSEDGANSLRPAVSSDQPTANEPVVF